MSIEEFAKLQAEMPTPELIEKARDYIRDVSKKGQRDWRMSIPPSRYDADMVLGEVCRRLEYMERRCIAAEAYIDESPCDPDITQAQWAAYRFWEGIKSVTP